MNRRFQFNITQQFLIFFLVTSILPMALLSMLFFKSIDNKFNERISRMLDIGGLFAEEVYQGNLEKLATGIHQAASFSILREYQQYQKTGRLSSLNKALDKYRVLRKLDFIAIYNRQGNLVSQAGEAQWLNQDSYRKALLKALSGERVQGLERISTSQPAKQTSLDFVVLSPIYSETGDLLGVLAAGQPMIDNFSFQDLIKAFPGLDLRIYTQASKAGHYRVLFSSIPDIPALTMDVTLNGLQLYPPQTYQTGDLLANAPQEQIGGETFKSKALILRNMAQEPIGLLVVSSSETDLQELKTKNIFYVALYIVFGLLLAGLIGVWFKRTFINPVQELSTASEQVAGGDLNTRLTQTSSQPEIEKTIASFNRMLEQLQEDEQLRVTFVSTLTHDLRTPLIAQRRVLKLYDEFQEELPKDMRDLNRQLLKNNEHLLDMVNKLLESYQYEAGKIVLAPEVFSLYQLVNECFEEVNPIAAGKKIKLENKVMEDVSLIYADRSQLKRVFQNLIGNAVENCPDGSRVTVSAIQEYGLLKVAVADNGSGIEPGLLPYLFTRYFTGNRLRQKIGSGLGLYICRMIVELHGGLIHAESQVGQGTKIIFEIPQLWQIRKELSHASPVGQSDH